MSGENAQQRLLNALEKIEKRINAAEARPSAEEIEKLKAEREEDLSIIRALRDEIKVAIGGKDSE